MLDWFEKAKWRLLYFPSSTSLDETIANLQRKWGQVKRSETLEGRWNEKSCCFWLLTWRTHACPGSLFSASAWVFLAWLGRRWPFSPFPPFSNIQSHSSTCWAADRLSHSTEMRWTTVKHASPTWPASKKWPKSMPSTHLSSTFE